MAYIGRYLRIVLKQFCSGAMPLYGFHRPLIAYDFETIISVFQPQLVDLMAFRCYISGIACSELCSDFVVQFAGTSHGDKWSISYFFILWKIFKNFQMINYSISARSSEAMRCIGGVNLRDCFRKCRNADCTRKKASVPFLSSLQNWPG